MGNNMTKMLNTIEKEAKYLPQSHFAMAVCWDSEDRKNKMINNRKH